MDARVWAILGKACPHLQVTGLIPPSPLCLPLRRSAFTAYNVARLPHLSKLTVSMYSGRMLAQLKQSGILQGFRSLTCQLYRLVLPWELTEGEAHSCAQTCLATARNRRRRW
jgi:hypothetical protein